MTHALTGFVTTTVAVTIGLIAYDVLKQWWHDD